MHLTKHHPQVLLSISLATTLTGCGLVDTQALFEDPLAKEETTEPAAASDFLQEQDLLSRAICLDGSGSTDKSFAIGIRDAIANAVAAWVPDAPTDFDEGAPGKAGLNVLVRIVTDRSGKFIAEHATLSVAAVPQLVPKPNIEADPYAIDKLPSWDKALERWKDARDKASQQATSGAAEIASLSTKAIRSDVYGCLTQAAQEMPGGDLLVASDLRSNVDPPGADVASLASLASLVAVVPCPSGDQSKCAKTTQQFISYVADLGGPNPVFQPAVDSPSAIAEFLER